MKKLFLILVVLAIAVPCLAQDEDPPDLNPVQPGDVFIQQPGGAAINSRSGEYYPSAGPSGVVQPSTGEFIQRTPNGLIDPNTGIHPTVQ
jgi:hypothetical protein